jgi:hypothetical protein
MMRHCIDQRVSLHSPTILKLLRYSLRPRISRRSLRPLKKRRITQESSDSDLSNNSATHSGIVFGVHLR